jgi:hypothetical protein
MSELNTDGWGGKHMSAEDPEGKFFPWHVHIYPAGGLKQKASNAFLWNRVVRAEYSNASRIGSYFSSKPSNFQAYIHILFYCGPHFFSSVSTAQLLQSETT